MPLVEVVGVHPVPSAEPCHLIEVMIRRSTEPIDLARFTQATSSKPPDRQVPYDEHFVTDAGLVSLWDEVADDAWTGDARLAFFFHYLDTSEPLLTPFGPVPLPPETSRPPHLDAMTYEEP